MKSKQTKKDGFCSAFSAITLQLFLGTAESVGNGTVYHLLILFSGQFYNGLQLIFISRTHSVVNAKRDIDIDTTIPYVCPSVRDTLALCHNG